MHQANISFAKIVATPTSSAWSQVYNAGSLFTVLSLNTSRETEVTLTSIGKNIINNLEAEFFTLETKTLHSIQQAVSTSILDIPEHIELSLVLAYIKENVLYILIFGSGTVVMKRDMQVVTLLEKTEVTKSFVSASGYLKQHDIVLLQTEQFTQLLTAADISQALELLQPNDIAEALSPKVHNAEYGGAASVILGISGVPKIHVEDNRESKMDKQHEPITPPVSLEKVTDEKSEPESPIEHSKKRVSFSKFLLHQKEKLFNKTVLLLIGTITLAILLIFTVITTLQNQKSQKLQKEFLATYQEIEKRYKDGLGIKTVNPLQARSEFQAAKDLLNNKLSTFPESFVQKKQLLILQEKIEGELAATSQSYTVSVKKAEKNGSLLLEEISKDENVVSGVQQDATMYLLTKTGITAKDTETRKSTIIIKSNNSWNNGVSLSTYNDNIYLLDDEKGVLKFVPVKNGYSMSNYFADTPKEVSNAVSMAIDGSVWLLSSDGKITKYTKGKQDSFSVKGLELPFKNPTYLFTNKDTTNLYILDNGNNRIVQLAKDGNYKSQFVTSAFRTSKFMEVNEADKKIFIITGDQVHVFNIQ